MNKALEVFADSSSDEDNEMNSKDDSGDGNKEEADGEENSDK